MWTHVLSIKLFLYSISECKFLVFATIIWVDWQLINHEGYKHHPTIYLIDLMTVVHCITWENKLWWQIVLLNELESLWLNKGFIPVEHLIQSKMILILTHESWLFLIFFMPDFLFKKFYCDMQECSVQWKI